MIYNSIIIGLGNIGYGSKIYNKFRSHFYTLIKNKNINLVGVIDNKDKILNKIKKKYKIQTYSSIKILKKNKKKDIDLAVISTPTKTHFKIANETINLINPKKILIEKPMSGNLINAKKLKSLSKKKISKYM